MKFHRFELAPHPALRATLSQGRGQELSAAFSLGRCSPARWADRRGQKIENGPNRADLYEMSKRVEVAHLTEAQRASIGRLARAAISTTVW